MACSRLTLPSPHLNSSASCPLPYPTWPKEGGKPPQHLSLSPSEPDHYEASHRASKLPQHSSTCRTRQPCPLFTPLPARAASCPPLDTARAPSPAYKRSPFLTEKIHTNPSYLPDILISLLALAIELAGVGRAPNTPAVPGNSDAAPTYRRSRAAEKDPHRRRDTSTPPVSTPTPAFSQTPLSLFPVGWGRRPRYRFRSVSPDSRAPFISPNFFFHPRTDALVGPAR
jgi:hypothetical protein